MAKSREGKEMIAVEMDTELHKALLELSADYGISVSGVVRMIAIDYLKRYKGYKPARKEKSK